MSLLQSFSGQVVTHGTLQSVLTGYKAPNFKIHRWLHEGRLLSLKKGLYAVVPQQTGHSFRCLWWLTNYMARRTYRLNSLCSIMA
ncbi:hypothetical protein ULF88_15690 [Halopseudomonas pachastrellae]|nr:hypothetical protein [Halopseudomonas pachastrellae]